MVGVAAVGHHSPQVAQVGVAAVDHYLPQVMWVGVDHHSLQMVQVGVVAVDPRMAWVDTAAVDHYPPQVSWVGVADPAPEGAKKCPPSGEAQGCVVHTFALSLASLLEQVGGGSKLTSVSLF